MKKSVTWLKGLSIIQKVLLGFTTLVILGAATGSSNNKTANLNATNVGSSNSVTSSPKQTSPKPSITTKTETETQAIPFTSSSVNNASLPSGQTKVTTVGVNGTETLTYQLTYTNGQQTDKKLISTAITTPPINQVTTVGTYVAPPPPPTPACTNGTYVNSAGNTVCSPETASSAPAGATAQCTDGTYSFSQSRSGTCSHHGGVSSWL